MRFEWQTIRHRCSFQAADGCSKYGTQGIWSPGRRQLRMVTFKTFNRSFRHTTVLADVGSTSTPNTSPCARIEGCKAPAVACGGHQRSSGGLRRRHNGTALVFLYVGTVGYGESTAGDASSSPSASEIQHGRPLKASLLRQRMSLSR